jgi:uncharacterized protein (DUF952 family)
MIYHITTNTAWLKFADHDYYTPDGFRKDGFIHCCKASQLSGVLHRYFQGMSDLVILHIDEQMLRAELKYECATDNEFFPHLYGPLNKDAVVKTKSFRGS